MTIYDPNNAPAGSRTSATQKYALAFGILYTLIGILGFIPGLTRMATSGDPALNMTTSYGFLLGLFAVNLLHNLVHIILGVWGIASYGSFRAARGFSRAMTVIFALLTIFGLIGGLDTLFGYVPLFGNDVWLHALTALVSAYFGWGVRSDTHTEVERTA